ncbi:MAG: BTAD domain-containing putative transcriptional regulator [Caldilineaceae bacterium]
MSNVKISLFGKLQIQYGNEQKIQLEQRRAQELLCYLFLHRDHLHQREKLATLFWPDSSPAQSKCYLRQTLWRVQSALNHSMQPKEQLLLATHEQIGVNQAASYWLDVASLEQAFTAAKDKPGRELTETTAELLRQAIRLYQGDLLEGWYQDWCIYERERYQSIYLALLEKLLGYSEAHGAYPTGLEYGAQILRYDRAREQTHRRLMRLHLAAGNRALAIHQYKACVTALREELNVAPDQHTTALYHKICRAENATVFSIAPQEPSLDVLDQQPETGTLQQLAQIQARLLHLEGEVTALMNNLTRQHSYLA